MLAYMVTLPDWSLSVYLSVIGGGAVALVLCLAAMQAFFRNAKRIFGAVGKVIVNISYAGQWALLAVGTIVGLGGGLWWAMCDLYAQDMGVVDKVATAFVTLVIAGFVSGVVTSLVADYGQQRRNK